MLIRYLTATKQFVNPVTLRCCSRSLRYGLPNSCSSRSFHQSMLRLDDDNNGRPHMHQLEHVQKRIEHCVTLMFRQNLDFTFYRKDVVMDNQILNVQKVGLDAYINHVSSISLAVNLALPYAELQALNIIPLLDDGTVRLRWRIRYQGWLTALSWRNFTGKLDFESSLKWFDGYSIFVVDSDGLVSKVTFQKCMPNDDKTLTTKKIAQKIVEKAQPVANASTPTNRP